MRSRSGIYLHVLVALFVTSASAAAISAEVEDRPAYNLLRWQEDYRFLQDPDRRTDFFDPVKYIPFDEIGSSYLTVSAQLREQSIRYDAPQFGVRNTGKDNYRFHRLLVAWDWHIDPSLRAFLELGNMTAEGKRRPLAASDQDRLVLQLAFLDYAIPLGDGKITVRGGRQEIIFDLTQRFLGVREGPNIRQAFDGGHVSWSSPTLRLTAFAASPVLFNNSSRLDDATDHTIHFSGARADLLKLGPGSAELNAYVYRYTNTGATLNGATAREERTAPGVRYAGKTSGWDWDIETMGQVGHIGSQRVRAYAVGSLLGYAFEGIPWSPRLGIQYDLASGDGNPRDGTFRVFNPLYNKGAYFTEAALTGYANLNHLKPSLSVRPTQQDSLYLGVGFVRKRVANDFVYRAPYIPTVGTNLIASKDVGYYEQLIASHKIGRHLSIDLEFVHFVVHEALQKAGARNTNYSKIGFNFLF